MGRGLNAYRPIFLYYSIKLLADNILNNLSPSVTFVITYNCN
jgi:hypothetical protein